MHWRMHASEQQLSDRQTAMRRDGRRTMTGSRFCHERQAREMYESNTGHLTHTGVRV